jgi:hypothetical protein
LWQSQMGLAIARDISHKTTVFGTVWLGVPKATCRRVSDLL